MLNKEGIKVTTLTKGFYPDEILDSRFLNTNEYGITLVSLSNNFKDKFEPFSAPYEKRVNSLKKIHEQGLKTWVSMEPYPTPNLDEDASGGIQNLLKKVEFVDKIVFGKLNYNLQVSRFTESEKFYSDAATTVIKFCEDNGIKYHIKFGTPYSKDSTRSLFKEE
jgi:DNA repair photolyase